MRTLDFNHNLTDRKPLFANGTEDSKAIGVPELEKILASPEDVLHVVNFWATWCPPCVTELPYFEKLVERVPG
ncbi:MAG: redoxin family protein [Marinilabiliales bacterium]|nr:redoxin family protein [Marinilabiliales bacterium]